MLIHVTRLAAVAVMLGLCVFCADSVPSQELVPPPIQLQPPPQAEPEIPKGVEVQARGPVHEAFAAPTTEPRATPYLNKKPPSPLEEMPPEEKPEGDVVWIGGYWSWDDDRADYLWVSGCWRVKPADKEWVPGYWREIGGNHQWAPGFWTNAQAPNGQAGVTYYPEPPAPPNVAPVGEPPAADQFHVPGYWMWTGDRYVWRAGYWTRVRPGYVYVASHYRWTPFGYVLVSGYWDYSISRRGVLYAPVYVDTVVVGPRYVYTPRYAVRDTIVLDTLFVRASHGSYYFGDYYGPRYVSIGFEPTIVYSRRHYEPLIVYERWVYRDNPRWHDTQVTLVIERHSGRAPVPPRTLVQQNTIIQKNVTVNNVTNVTNVTNVIAPTRTVVAARGEKVVPLDTTTRAQVREGAVHTQKTVAAERLKAETPGTSGSFAPPTKPRTAALTVPNTTPVAPKSSGFTPKSPLKDSAKSPFQVDPKGITGPIPGKDGTRLTPPPLKDGSKIIPPPPKDGSKIIPPPPKDGSKIIPPPIISNPPRDKGSTILPPPLPKTKKEEPKKK